MDKVSYCGKRLLRAVFVTPLVAGNATYKDGRYTKDGSLSSVLAVSCLTVGMLVPIGIYSGKRMTNGKYLTAILLLMTILTLLALIAVALISRLAFKNRAEWLTWQSVKAEDTSGIKVKFLWLCGCGDLFLRTTGIAINIECLLLDSGLFYSIILLVYHLISLFFKAAQVWFITFFKDYKFKSCLLINYGILLILLTNLSHWFSSLMLGDMSDNAFVIGNQTNSSSKQKLCYTISNILEFRQKILPYFMPFEIEYSLLAVSLILSMWPSVQRGNEDTADQTADVTPEDLSCNTENTPLLNLATKDVKLINQHPGSYFVIIMTGIVLNVSIAITSLLTSYVKPKEFSFKYSWQVVLSLYKVSMLVMIIIIFINFGKHGRSQKRYKTLHASEYILIFASSGVAAVSTCSVMIGLWTNPIARPFFVLENTVGLLSSFLQTILIIHSYRVSITPETETSVCIQYVYFLLSICNLVLWCEGSFFVLEIVPNEHVNLTVYDEILWHVIKTILVPTVLFYRMNSFVELYGVYKKLTPSVES